MGSGDVALKWSSHYLVFHALLSVQMHPSSPPSSSWRTPPPAPPTSEDVRSVAKSSKRLWPMFSLLHITATFDELRGRCTRSSLIVIPKVATRRVPHHRFGGGDGGVSRQIGCGVWKCTSYHSHIWRVPTLSSYIKRTANLGTSNFMSLESCRV